MGLNYAWTAYQSSVIDLTSITTNVDAVPEITPRQGGFVIRNRWNAANLTTANKTTIVAVTSANKADITRSDINNFYVIKVPKRTLVKDVHVFAVPSLAIPEHAVASATTTASLNSIGAAGQICFNATQFVDPAQTAASVVDMWQTAAVVEFSYDTASIKNSIIGCIFGGLNVAKFDSSGGAFDQTFEKHDASMTLPADAGVRPVWMDGTVPQEPVQPVYYPHGGYVTMSFGPLVRSLGTMAGSSGSEAVGMTATFSGGFEVQANCQYVPE